MFSWRHSFEKINSEYQTVLKKRQALNSLFSSGRISQSTFEIFDREIEEALAEIERQRKVLLERMASKVREVEEQIKILERLLANYEIQHVSGEIDEEVYRREITLLSTGLESARRELDAIKETMDKLAGASTPSVETVVQQTVETKTVEKAEAKVEKGEIEVSAEAQAETPTEASAETHVETQTVTENVAEAPASVETQTVTESVPETAVENVAETQAVEVKTEESSET